MFKHFAEVIRGINNEKKTYAQNGRHWTFNSITCIYISLKCLYDKCPTIDKILCDSTYTRISEYLFS